MLQARTLTAIRNRYTVERAKYVDLALVQYVFDGLVKSEMAVTLN